MSTVFDFVRGMLTSSVQREEALAAQSAEARERGRRVGLSTRDEHVETLHQRASLMVEEADDPVVRAYWEGIKSGVESESTA